MTEPRVFSIDPADPFLATLALRIADGTLWPDGRLPDDPLALADVTVYLPTRRAARALARDFLDLRRPATVLPRIAALGDAEDGLAARPGAIGTLEARVALAFLVRSWARRLEAGWSEPDARVLHRTGAADAIALADDLLALMDQVETQEADWAALPGLVERTDLAQHWEITTDFLAVATTHWPDYVAAAGKISAAAGRRREAEEAAAGIAAARGPVIVAGSTGSIPATRRLIAAIAQNPFGAVVLPGFDRAAREADWAALGDAADGPGHPQYGMRQLVDALAVSPEAVRRLPPGRPSRTPPARTALLAAALRPAPATGLWLADRDAIDLREALAGLTLLEAADEREEAAAIAVAMRRSAEAGETVALVTPHRALARRVAHALRRWDIAVDDSAGEPLDGTPAGTLARLVAAAAVSGAAAEWLALLKHPLAGFGLSRAALSAGTRAAERLLRGPRLAPGSFTAALRSCAARPRRRGEDAEAPPPDAGEAVALAAAIDAAFRPLHALRTGEHSVAAFAAAHAAVLEAVLQRPDPDAAPRQASLFGDAAPTATVRADGGRDLAELDAALADLATRDALLLPAADWPGAFDALLAGLVVRGEQRDDAVRILGPLEARLQGFDHVVLGALNEGTWPQLPDAGPWMSRGMMKAFGIELPERRIGLSAHDAVMAAHAPRATLSRARKAGGEPTVASRWWQRLGAFAAAAAAPARAAGAELVALAAQLDTRPPAPRAPRPAPTPPVSARPTRLRVTEVSRLVRDPYAVYAERILGLRPLDALELDPTGGDRGELFHAVLAAWVASGRHRGPDAAEALVEIGTAELARLADAPAAAALWGARLAFVAPEVAAREAARPPAAHVLEATAEMSLAGDAVLRGRIDRIDVSPDGLAVIDYKTGSLSTAQQVRSFLDPQLPLSAALARAGAVPGVPPALSVRELVYVALARGREPVKWCEVAGGTGDALAAEALMRLEALLARYRDVAFGYLSRARVAREAARDGPYDHLARVAEWADAEGAAAAAQPAVVAEPA